MLPELIVLPIQYVFVSSTIGRKARILLVLAGHWLLQGNMTPFNGLPWTVVSAAGVGRLLSLFFTINDHLLLRLCLL